MEFILLCYNSRTRNYEFPLDSITLLYLIMYVALTVSGFRIKWVSAFSPVTFTCPYVVLYLNNVLDGIFYVS